MFAQGRLEVHAEIENPSKGINDGLIELQVRGGLPPYQYKWSDRDIPLDADKATGLTEGISYTVAVTDAAGDTVKETFEVQPLSISERFEGVVMIVKEWMDKILFFDPFSALGLYDPVFYAGRRAIEMPSRSGEGTKITFEEREVPDGQAVEREALLALVARGNKEI